MYKETDINNNSVVYKNAEFDDRLLTLASTNTVLQGTILAVSVATGKYIPYVKDGVTDGNGIPKAVLTYEIFEPAIGDVSVRGMISGVVNADQLVIYADGDASNVDSTVKDLMRDFTIVALDVFENTNLEA